MARKRKQGLYERVANYIFVMQKLLERMDKDGHLDEEKREVYIMGLRRHLVL
jgi:hypothetical protein